MSVRQQPATGDGDSGDERDFPLSDAPLLDLLDALVNDRGRVAGAEALGVNYRTMMACYDSRHVSRRMRKALGEFRDAGTREDGGAEAGDDGAADEVETLRQRVAELEEEARGLRGLVETQTGQLEELGRRVAQLVREAQQRGESSRWLVMTSRPCGVLLGGVTGCLTPVWSRWGNSPTRTTPSARRRNWWPSGGSCEPAETRLAAGLTGPGPGCAGGSWRRSCSRSFT